MDVPGALPAPASTFVGRRRELDEIRAALASKRVLTLTGAGGCGKSRLALEAAREAAGRHPDGLWWVELAPLADPGLVAPAVAGALGVRPLPGHGDLDAAAAFLSARRALLVLDNCEHLLDPVAAAVKRLAEACPGLTVLATSREPLRVPGEAEWRVPSLALADAAGGAAGSDAVRLFAERAGEVRPGFSITAGNAATVAAICRELDGIALAIELGAARLRVLSLEQVAEGLGDRFRLLGGGARTAMARQRTLRASVDWSHDLLDEDERVLFRRLAVFAGGWTLELAEEVCAWEPLDRSSVLDLLASLVEKSLVQADVERPRARYAMLETVRQYAAERLAAAEEEDVARDRHRDACLVVAERAAAELLTPRQASVLADLDAEGPNLEQAVRRAAGTRPQIALRLCGALAVWWRLRGLFSRAEAAIATAVAAAPPEASALRAGALWTRGYLMAFAGRLDAAAAAAEDALDDAQRVGDDVTTGRALMVLGKCALMRETPAAARRPLERAEALAVAAGDDLCLMHVAQALAFSHLFEDDHAAARRRFDAVLPVVRRTGHHEFLGNHWAALAWARYVAGDLPGALEAADRALAVAREVGDTVTEAGAAAYAGCALADSGRPSEALERLVPVHGRAVARGAGFLLPWAEIAMARAHAAAGDLASARAGFEATLRGAGGSVLYATAWARAGHAETLRLLGEADAAEGVAWQAMEAADRLASPWLGALARLAAGRLAAGREAWTEAERLHHDALAGLVAGGHRSAVPEALEGLAGIAAGVADHEQAARLLGAARRARDELGSAAWAAVRSELEHLAAAARDALGEAAFERAVEDGASLGPDDAVAWVRRARGPRRRPPGGWEALTPTELEVVRHAAAGLSNPEIATRMFVSRHTVKVHLAHVYAKLGLRNRAELAREAARRTVPADGRPAGANTPPG